MGFGQFGWIWVISDKLWISPFFYSQISFYFLIFVLFTCDEQSAGKQKMGEIKTEMTTP